MLSWIRKFCSLIGESRRAGYLTLLFILALLALLASLVVQVRTISNVSRPAGIGAANVPGLGLLPTNGGKNVLVLNSYHFGYSWSDDETDGIIEALRKADPTVRPRIEYLDCKHYPAMQHFDLLRDLFLEKYRDKHLPVVIAADNPALEFALRYRQQLFPDAAIVFCGINGYTPKLIAGQRNVTGVAELLDANGTVAVALRLHPRTREIVVVHDYSITGLSTRRETEQQLKPFESQVHIRYMPNLSLQDLMAALRRLPADRLVLALSYSLDKNGQVINHEKIARLLSENSPVPVYGVHQERLGYGIVGGWLLDGRRQGARAAEIAARILAGTPASSIPVNTQGVTRLFFDYNQIVRFGIPLTELPKEATVVNLPISFFTTHRGLVLTTAGIIALLGGGIAILLFNIVRRKVAEEDQRRTAAQLIQSQKMEAIGHLAGGIAHDFNNILTAIIGYANLLRKRLAGDEAALSYVDQVLTASSRAARLTKGLLAFSRRQVMEPSVVDVNELVGGIERIAGRIIGEDIEFTTVLHPEPLSVLADAGQIDQVLLNLCTNARDAMPNGGRLAIVTSLLEVDEEYCRTHFFDRPGSFAVISVSDTGTGMDEKTKRQIFEPFFTTKEVGKGTGLGLAIAYGIIKQHNGTINVYSEPGLGTTFKIFLPLTAERERAEAVVAAESPRGGSETVLIAEDEEEVRNMLKLVLTDAGYKVIVAADGDEALARFRKDPDAIRLLLSDVIMPKRNGKELAEAIRAVRPDVKLLFMSGYTADIVQKKGIINDAEYRFLSKPVIPDQLLRTVRAILDDGKK